MRKYDELSFIEISLSNVADMAKFTQLELGDLMTILNRNVFGRSVMVPYYSKTETMLPSDPVRSETCDACNQLFFSVRGPKATYHYYLFHLQLQHTILYNQEVINKLGIWL